MQMRSRSRRLAVNSTTVIGSIGVLGWEYHLPAGRWPVIYPVGALGEYTFVVVDRFGDKVMCSVDQFDIVADEVTP